MDCCATGSLTTNEVLVRTHRDVELCHSSSMASWQVVWLRIHDVNNLIKVVPQIPNWVQGVWSQGECSKLILVLFEPCMYDANYMTHFIVLMEGAIMQRKKQLCEGRHVHKNRYILPLIHCAFYNMSTPRECHENILQTITLPPPARTLLAICWEFVFWHFMLYASMSISLIEHKIWSIRKCHLSPVSGCLAGVLACKFQVSLLINSCQHSCVKQPSAAEPYTQQHSMNCQVVPLFIWVVSWLMVSHLLTQTYLSNHHLPLSFMIHGTPYLPCYWFWIIPFCDARYTNHGSMQTVHNISHFGNPSILCPEAKGQRLQINRSVSALLQRLQCFLLPSNTLYISFPVSAATCLLWLIISCQWDSRLLSY